MTVPAARTGPDSAASWVVHQTGPIDGRLLRRICGTFVTGVTVITGELDGTPLGTTVNSFTSVSLDPPMVLFCLHRDSRMLSALRASGRFAVNVLTGRQEELAWDFAKGETALGHEAVRKRSATGVPIVNRALSFLACRLAAEYGGGDHAILLGEVVEVGVPRHGQRPLIFYSGSMGVLEDGLPSWQPIWDG